MQRCRLPKVFVLFLMLACSISCFADSRGQWPMLRHDPHLLGRQTMTGRMARQPTVLARHATAGTQAQLVPTDLDGDESPDIVLGFRAGTLKSVGTGRRLIPETNHKGSGSTDLTRPQKENMLYGVQATLAPEWPG